MGHKQTAQHVPGRHSYHQIGLVRGQFGHMRDMEFLEFLREAGFDGYEEACWLLDLGKCRNDTEASAYAQERAGLLGGVGSPGLGVFSVAAHLPGQALGDEPSAKTLQFLGGESVEAYGKWRSGGNSPPRNDPFFVPSHVANIARQQATDALVNTVRFAHFMGKLQNRTVPVSGFVGSPANCWSHWFRFPPIPKELGGHPIPDVFQVSLELLVERFGPVLDACKRYGTTFDLECHPSERAMGDIASAAEYLNAMDKAGYASVTGFNLDASHMEWQGVSVIEFIREFGDRIHCVHLKGVQVARGYTRNGLLGGHRPMGDRYNGWNFVTAGTTRDATPLEEIIVELNHIGYSGALSIEWEDNDVNCEDGASRALKNVRDADPRPSTMAHDEQLKV